MTNNIPRDRGRASGWPKWLIVVLAVTVATALSSFGFAPQARAEGWSGETVEPYSYKGHGRSARASSGESSLPEVAPKRRRSHSSSYASSDDNDGGNRATRSKRTRTARAKSNDDDDSGYSAKPKVGGGHVSWAASGSCLPGELKSVIAEVSQYGSVTVSSTGRDHSHNARVGGAKSSYHLSCQAADFRVHGNVASAASFLRNHGSVGGFHHYGGGLFHIDTGPKRTW